jgi:hypothetical protein
MADQDPYASTAIKKAAKAPGGDPYAATAAQTSAPLAPPIVTPTNPNGLRPLTDRERFLNPNLYPVGQSGQGIGENLYNLTQRAGVGVFQLADAVSNPRQSIDAILSSVLPEPAVHAANKVVDFENKIPGMHYLTTKLPENIPHPVQQAYEAMATSRGPMELAGKVAPLAGQAIAGDVGALAGPEVAAAAFSRARRVPEAIARAATNTGKAPIEQLVKDTQAANEKVDAVNLDRTEAQRTKQAEADTEYHGDLLKLRQKYGQQVRDANQKFAGNKSKAEQANAEALRAYNQKVGQVIQQRRAAAATEWDRSAAAAQTQVVGSQLIYRVGQLDKALRAQANALYSKVSEIMSGASLSSDAIADGVKAAQQEWIRGSPAKVAEFNAMLSTGTPGPELVLADQTAQNMGYKDFHSAITNPQMRDTLSRALPPDVWQAAIGQGTRPISWNDLQGFYEETGAKIAEGPQPGKGDIYKALQQVHQFVGDQMQELARQRGAGSQFRDARSFYRDYMNAFHEPSGPSGSGSPVAQVLLAKDPAVAIAKFSGSAGDRGVALLRQYDPNLADLAQQARGIKRGSPTAGAGRTAPKSITDLPAPKQTSVPAGANLPLPPVLPEPKTIPLELRPHQTISSPDIAAARRAAAETRANKVWNRGQWAATWPIFQAARALWGGHIPSIPIMGLESAGMLATVKATTGLMRYPPMIRFLSEARPEDVPLIPPELRGDLPGLVSLAQRQGIKVSPALVAAAAAGTSAAQSPVPVAQALQAMQPTQSQGAPQ